MNLRQLEYFIRVAELGSLSKAALILNVAQPALSRQIRLLETDLRTSLLQRTGRGVVLTDAGKRLFDHSIGILQLVAQAREGLEATRNEPTGHVVIGLPPSLGRILTLPLVEAFRDSLPKARLTIVEGLSTHITEWISTGRVDVGFVHNPESQLAIETRPVLDEPLCLVSPAKMPLPGGRNGRGKTDKTLPFNELPNYPLVIPERTHAIRKLLETQAALAGLKLQIAWEVSSVQSILELVRTGHGYAVLTHSAVLATGNPRDYRAYPLSDPKIISKLSLANSAYKPMTPLVSHMMQLLSTLVIQRVTGDAHINS